MKETLQFLRGFTDSADGSFLTCPCRTDAPPPLPNHFELFLVGHARHHTQTIVSSSPPSPAAITLGPRLHGGDLTAISRQSRASMGPNMTPIPMNRNGKLLTAPRKSPSQASLSPLDVTARSTSTVATSARRTSSSLPRSKNAGIRRSRHRRGGSRIG